MPRHAPVLLRLPFWLADRFSLEEALARGPDASWRRRWRSRESFALSRPEERFARHLLRRKRNLWLYRCHQRAFCGDFLLVDMSAAAPSARRAWAIELKAAAPIRVGGGGAGNQLHRIEDAVLELRARGALGRQAQVTLVTGSGPSVLEHLGA